MRTCVVVVVTSVILASASRGDEKQAAFKLERNRVVLERNQKTGKVVKASFMAAERKNADLALLLQMPALEELVVGGFYAVVDDDAKVIGKLKSLRRLQVSGAAFTDAGIANLKGLANLKALYLDTSQPLTGESFKVIRGFKDLEILNFSAISLKPGDLKGIGDLKKVTHLSLMGKAVNDDALKEIATLPALSNLNLSECSNFSVAGVKELAAAPQLTELTLIATPVARKAAEVQAALPKVKINK